MPIMRMLEGRERPLAGRYLSARLVARSGFRDDSLSGGGRGGSRGLVSKPLYTGICVRICVVGYDWKWAP